MINPYDVLGVTRDVSPDEVKRVYRRLALEWHPDRNSAPEAAGRFQVIAEAYAILTDPSRRAAWHSAESDAWLRYIEDGTPLPWEANTRPTPLDFQGPLPWDSDEPLPWETGGPFPWDGSDLPF